MIGLGTTIFHRARSAATSVIYFLRNVLNSTATTGADSTFTRGGSPATVRAWDATTGLKLVTSQADEPVSEGMRYDAGTWLNDDGAGNALHPTNADGAYLDLPARMNNEAIGPDATKRQLGTAEPHDYYYESVAMGEEVITPLLVAGVGATISETDGVTTQTRNGSSSSAYVTGLPFVTSGAKYQVSIDLISINAPATVSVRVGGVLTPLTVGINTFEVTTVSSVYLTIEILNYTTGTAVYRDVSLKLIPNTSLTSPLRDSLGRMYEERVVNGGFDVDYGWVKNGNWAISGGSASCTSTGVNEDIYQSIVTTIGNTYTVSCDVSGVVGAPRFYVDASHEALVNGPYERTFTATATFATIRVRMITGGYSVTIDNVSVTEVDALGNPTNVLDGGRRVAASNYLLNSGAPITQTTGSLAIGWYTLWATGTGTVTVSAGTATISTTAMGAVTDGTDGSYIWFEVTGAGTVTVTVAGTLGTFDLIGGTYTPAQQPHIVTTSAPVTEAANVASSVVWQYGGRYNNTGKMPYLLHEGAATNLFLNSDAPVTQNITTTAQAYVLSMTGTGSITASGTGSGVATEGSPLTFTATAGTLTLTKTGTVTTADFCAETVPTSHIPTTTAPVTRAATSQTSPIVFSADRIQLRIMPSGLSETFLSDGTNALTYTGTALQFTDGTNILTHTVTLADADVVGIDFALGTLYLNGTLVDTNALVSPTWGALTDIGNITDLKEDATLDLTSIAWSK
ncbi:hypothetical protein [Geopsychrobacter electrodiphilus]|uniref:hypothetical protein n=1 Tax=Geopsychrobacter electrodiphilus TaxID=225196 RepID=UPI00036BBF08|nr:hypothetical protein [Geopsychrobacter electrodiphilus]